MAICKDCFHWEACRAMFEAAGGIIVPDDFKGSAVRCKHFVSTADVVPKSKVFLASSDAMKMLIECHGYALTHDEDIKKEVAREIFEEIERKSCVISETNYSAGVTRVVCYQISEESLAELKKKYTED